MSLFSACTQFATVVAFVLLLFFVVTKEIKHSNEVCFPSVNRYVVLEGFLMPLANQLFDEARETMFPRLTDYDAELNSKDCRPVVLTRFDRSVSHIIHKSLVAEARLSLEEKLNAVWEGLLHKNEVFGSEVVESTTESREIVLRIGDLQPLGGTSLLSPLRSQTRYLQVQMRSVLRRKRGDVEYSNWAASGGESHALVEQSLHGYEKLPQHEAHLCKETPGLAAHVMSLGLGQWQDRLCVLKDAHFLWYKSEGRGEEDDEDSGCINFLLQRAEILPKEGSKTAFVIRPASEDGWEAPFTFSGGATREFLFDCRLAALKSQDHDNGTTGNTPNSKEHVLESESKQAPGLSLQSILQGFCCMSNSRRCVLVPVGTQAPGASESERRRNEWVAALRKHAAFGQAVREELGRARISEAFPARHYHLNEVRSGWHHADSMAAEGKLFASEADDKGAESTASSSGAGTPSGTTD
eukprot:TRINITY_DN14702_c0_g1_i1.p1 TRINITY_DN14702_c0_g1~~TRINITY_DN14702_c0_g1_i1.p1  ORF type:complete len:468 (+),score=59.13 TRINITY_DN14702_c0_g1_i1:1177-2580(+)